MTAIPTTLPSTRPMTGGEAMNLWLGPNRPAFLTPHEVAALLRMPVKTVWAHLREGGMPGVKAGKQYRISRDELDAWVKSGGNAKPKKQKATKSAPVFVPKDWDPMAFDPGF